MQNVKMKIKKLIALAQSPNEYEARAALLKARQLMAENKLTYRECEDIEKQTVKKIITEYSYNTRRDPYLHDLSVIIAENHCCQSIAARTTGKQTRIKEAGKGIVRPGKQTYSVSFATSDPFLLLRGISDDETELTAYSMKDLEELWGSLCPELHCETDSVISIEKVEDDYD